MQVTTIGLDIAKNVFQVHGIDAAEKVVVRKQLRRRQMLEFFKALPPCLIGMVRRGNPMDQRIEAFLGDVLALAGEEPDAVQEGVRVALAKCEAIFRLQEPKKRMRDQAARACRALCRARVAEELQRRRGTRIGEHLKLVLSIIGRRQER